MLDPKIDYAGILNIRSKRHRDRHRPRNSDADQSEWFEVLCRRWHLNSAGNLRHVWVFDTVYKEGSFISES